MDAAMISIEFMSRLFSTHALEVSIPLIRGELAPFNEKPSPGFRLKSATDR
jgi:hypothetical protein